MKFRMYNQKCWRILNKTLKRKNTKKLLDCFFRCQATGYKFVVRKNNWYHTKKIYQDKEIDTNITKKDIKELLLLSTKNVHLRVNSKIYVQKDKVAVVLSLSPVLVDIFVVELEQTVVPKLVFYLNFWRRYVGDTIFLVK